MSRTKRLFAALVGGALLLPILAGCSAKAPALTKEEQSQFKGGPMPASAVQGMQQRLQKAQQTMPANAPANAGPQ
ncbi:MAG TPA: hypothetical protein VFB38_26125 [Chthonomonadaceae bacterium]|nr:hypothetical protein [Chthonomonadaceae bacterium]